MAQLDPTGFLSAIAQDVYRLGKEAATDVITPERKTKELRGRLNDTLAMVRGFVDENASPAPEVVETLKELEDVSKQLVTKQSLNPSERWSAAQKIKAAKHKFNQLQDKCDLKFHLLNRQDMAVVHAALNTQNQLQHGISAQLLKLITQHDTPQLALRYGEPPAACSSRFHIVALPPPDVSPIGIDEEMSTLSSWLLEEGGVPCICVSGMGGIGKSFLVHTVCLLPEVRQHFQDRILRVRLGTNVHVLELQRELREAISGREARLLPSPEDGRDALYSLTSRQRYLVVLDDAWMPPDAPLTAHRALLSLNFLQTSNGSRMIVTSRNRNILARLGLQHRPLKLRGLNDNSSYTLFCKHAFDGEEAPSNLEEHARYLVRRCEGLPLVLEVTGKAMRSKREPAQWKLMLEKLSRGHLDERGRILELLRMSYDQLSPVQQGRFLALAILDDLDVYRQSLRMAWQSMDLLQLDNYKDEEVAECAFKEALEELVSYSLAPPHFWIQELAWHIIREKMQNLEQAEEHGGSSTCFRVAAISEKLAMSRQIKSPFVLPSLKLLMAHDTSVVESNRHNLLQLRFLHVSWFMNKLSLDLSFLKRMPNLTYLALTRNGSFYPAIRSLHATSGSSIKHCHKLRYLHLREAHLVDAHLNDLLHPKSSLVEADIESMPIQSVSGYKGFIPATLESFQVRRWIDGVPASNFNEPVFSSSDETSSLSISLAMEKMPESFGHLHSLQELKLDGCRLLAHLTPLCQLRRLESLDLKNCAVQRLSSLSLPALRWLKIYSCQSLVEIWEIDAPELRRLVIDDCKSLAEVRKVHAPELTSLEIWRSSISVITPPAIPAERYRHSDAGLNISLGCGIREPLTAGCLQALSKLDSLWLGARGSLLHLPSFATLPRLRELRLFGCALECLPLASGPPGFPALEVLEIRAFKNLVKIQGLYAARLAELYLKECPSLVEIQGLHCPGLREFDQSSESGSGYKGFIPATLKSFQVQRWTEGGPTSINEPVFSTWHKISSFSISLPMDNMPESFGGLHSLQRLDLDGCGLLTHLTPLGRLQRLEYLELRNCAMQWLSSLSLPVLESLNIYNCQSLVEVREIDAPQLRKLYMGSCKSLVEVRKVHAPELTSLEIWGDEGSTLTHDGCSSGPVESYPHSDTSLNISLGCVREPLTSGCLEALSKLEELQLGGRGALLHLPSFTSLPSLRNLWLFDCALECLHLASGPPGFPALENLEICRFKHLMKIQGLYAAQLTKLSLIDCSSLVEIQGLHCPNLQTIRQFGLGGEFPDLRLQQNNQATTIYRQQNRENAPCSGSNDPDEADQTAGAENSRAPTLLLKS